MTPPTQRTAVLQAAAVLDGWIHPTNLLLAAHERAAVLLGLDGAPNHPSDRKLNNLLCGQKGMVAQGWLERNGKGNLRITPKGLEYVARLRDEDAPTPPTPSTNGHQEPAELTRLLTHDAMLLDTSGSFAEIHSTLAYDFWGWKPGQKIADCIDRLDDNLREWRQDGVSTEGQLNLVASLHERLQGKFAKHLKLAMGRGAKEA